MQFNVSSLLKEAVGATREYDIDEDVRVDGVARHLTGRVRFDRTRDGILVRATLQGDQAADCGRCLKPMNFPVRVSFDEEFIPTVDVDSGARITPPEGEEEAYRIDTRHMLNLTEAIDQYWAMVLPLAPVCRDDCPGICPACGQDLDRAVHNCAAEQTDARWAKLQDLKLGS